MYRTILKFGENWCWSIKKSDISFILQHNYIDPIIGNDFYKVIFWGNLSIQFVFHTNIITYELN